MGVEYLVGDADRDVTRQPLVPYHDLVCECLSRLSTELMSDVRAREFPDVISFAYWCRKSNIERLRRQFSAEERTRIGVGVAFHVTPSNVPVNFAFSYVLSLLAGNANIVRVPSRAFPQVDLVCDAIARVFDDPKYRRIAQMTMFVRYEQNDAITGEFSALCDARLIWGGDHAVQSIRMLPTPVRCVEVAFTDRYSFCVMAPTAILQADDRGMTRLAEAFYNDAFVMDQNACSSPHMIIWLNGTQAEVVRAKDRFWREVHVIASAKYDLQPVNAVDKYTALCRDSIELDGIVAVETHDNYVYRVAVGAVSEEMDSLRGKFGYFYEFETDDLSDLVRVVNTRYQTLTYFGVDRTHLVSFVLDNGLMGIDRIVPVGQALDMDVLWDGYDIVRTLSRVIDVK